MRRRRFVNALRGLCCLLVGCSTPAKAPSSFEDAAVVRFHVEHFAGSYRFAVFPDGRAIYETLPSREERGGTFDASATPAELHYVAKVLRENGFCALTSQRDVGVPDEAHPGITVSLEGLQCSVSLWDEEWRGEPKAKACLDAVEDLGRALKGRGTRR